MCKKHAILCLNVLVRLWFNTVKSEHFDVYEYLSRNEYKLYNFCLIKTSLMASYIEKAQKSFLGLMKANLLQLITLKAFKSRMYLHNCTIIFYHMLIC